ncbi:hypothetical protein EV363DRAFT_140655 [Boletus edulis]|nr:hypothetical protein EV363DRAFT_140655 [Boletus edulis]
MDRCFFQLSYGYQVASKCSCVTPETNCNLVSGFLLIISVFRQYFLFGVMALLYPSLNTDETHSGSMACVYIAWYTCFKVRYLAPKCTAVHFKA